MATATAPDRQAGFDPELRRLALVVVTGAIMTILDTTIVNVAITPLGHDFHTSLSTIQWVLTGYTLALAMTIPVTGWAVERFGSKAAWITSLLVFIAGSVLCGVAWNVTSLIIFRVVQGAGGGMIMPIGQTMLARKAGPERMARVMAVVAVPAMLGPVLGPVLGGLIIDDLSWRWMFYVNVPFCVLALFLAFRFLPKDTDRVPAKIDALGLALLSPGLAALIYGLSKAGTDNRQLWIWLAAGAVLVLAFTVYALRVRRVDPLVSVRAFARRAFGMSSLSIMIYTGGFFGFMVVMPVYFQVVRGESPLRAGLLMAPMGIGSILTMTLSGRLTDKVAARWILLAGMVIVAAGAAGFTRLSVGTSLALVAGAMFVAGLGHGAIMPPAMGSAYQGMPRPEIPAATATFNAVLRVGSSFGTAALAVVLQQAISHRIPGATGGLSAAAAMGHSDRILTLLTSAFGVSFWWVAGLAIAAVIPALFIPSLRRATSGPVASAAEPAVPEAAEDAPPVPVTAANGTAGVPGLPGRGPAAAGYVRRGNGAALPGATVTLIDPAGRQAGTTRTGPDGRYEVPAPARGTYTLIAMAAAYEPSATAVRVDDGPAETDLLLSGAAALSGLVRTAGTSEPLAGVTVTLADEQGTVVGTAVTGADGSYSLDGLASGQYTLAASAPSLQPVALPAIVGAGQPTVLNADLRPGARVRGAARTGSGTAVADALVTLLNPDGRVAGVVTTGPDGSYSFENLAEGEYTVIGTGYPPAASRLTVAGSDPHRHDVELRRPEA